LQLGYPAATGAQNSERYAYFPKIRRLAVEHDGRVEVYDTTGYEIRGFAQQQQNLPAGVIAFMTQRGVVRPDSFPRVPFEKPAVEKPQAPRSEAPATNGDANSIVALIEQLAQLKEKGVLTDSEFATKKAELLKRL